MWTNKYKIIKEIGKGYYNNVYLLDNNMVLRRRKKIIKDKYNYTNLINFYKFINNLGNDVVFFNKMIDYKIEDDIFDIVIDLKDGTAKELIYNKISIKVSYSMIIQFLYALYVLHYNNYSHYDNNASNICYVKVNKTDDIYLSLFDIHIQSYGYQFSIIDYDDVVYNGNKNLDLDIFIMKCILKISLKKYGIFDSFQEYKKVAYYVYENDKILYDKIKKKIMKYNKHIDNLQTLFNDFENKTNIKKYNSSYKVYVLENEITIYTAIYNKKLFCEILKIPYFKNLCKKKLILYIKKHYYNLKKIIKYFIKRL